MRVTRKIILAFAGTAATFAAALAGCGGGSKFPAGGGGGGPATINTINNAAAPMGFSFASPVTVKSGTSVTWVNQSGAPHSIVWDSVSPASSPPPGAGIGLFAAGQTSTAWIAPTVTSQTTYNYHCGIHGPQMAGVVIVTP